MNQLETSKSITSFFAHLPDEQIQSMDGGIADIGDLVA